MIGDENDLISRLQRWLPQGWFPNDAGTRIYSVLAGAASVLSTIYGMIAYAKLQTRVATATDGFLDLASRDYLGDELPRLPGETDPAFSARIRANVFLPANTRTAIKNALENLTGNPVRMIEPWQPNDGATYGGSFYGYDRAARPGQYQNGGTRYKGLICCALPLATNDNLQRRGYSGIFYGNAGTYSTPSGSFYSEVAPVGGEQLVFDAIARLKVYGTKIYVKFLPPSQLP